MVSIIFFIVSTSVESLIYMFRALLEPSLLMETISLSGSAKKLNADSGSNTLLPCSSKRLRVRPDPLRVWKISFAIELINDAIKFS
ncbi:hypothetical protein D3C71_1230960 [compost metagenome]